jgi:hypothetical protein
MREQRTLGDLVMRVFGRATLLGVDGNVVRFGHGSEEAAMCSVALNRTVYGHEAGYERGADGMWVSWVDASEAVAAMEGDGNGGTD